MTTGEPIKKILVAFFLLHIIFTAQILSIRLIQF